MSWIKLDDGFADHPKIMGLPSDALRWFHIRALCYAARYRTGGVITAATLRGLGGKPGTAKTLCDAGLWDPVEGGAWLIHDFEEYNPPKREVPPELSAVRAEAGRKGGRARVANLQATQSKGIEAIGLPNLLPRTAARGRPVPSRPVPSQSPTPGNTPTTPSSSSLPPAAESGRDDDDDSPNDAPPDDEFEFKVAELVRAMNVPRIEPSLGAELRLIAEEQPLEAIRTAIRECVRDGVKPWPREIVERLPRPESDGLEARKQRYGWPRPATDDLEARKRRYGWPTGNGTGGVK